jgi:hypothetical protein
MPRGGATLLIDRARCQCDAAAARARGGGRHSAPPRCAAARRGHSAAKAVAELTAGYSEGRHLALLRMNRSHLLAAAAMPLLFICCQSSTSSTSSSAPTSSHQGSSDNGGIAFDPDPPTSAACIEVLANEEGWNGSQENPACEVQEPDRAHCPLITVRGTAGHFKASATGAWQNDGISLGVFGKMGFDYNPQLTGTITCPEDGRAEIHWDQITSYWKLHSAKYARACSDCLHNRRGSAWGGSLILWGGMLVLCYLGGGLAFNMAVRGQRPPEAFPHREYWRELGALVRDGVAFTRAAARGDAAVRNRRHRPDTQQQRSNSSQKGGYQHHRAAAAGHNDAVSNGGGRGNSKLGRATKEKANKRKKEKRESKSSCSDGAELLLAPAAEPTSARGSGRWVHLPS